MLAAPFLALGIGIGPGPGSPGLALSSDCYFSIFGFSKFFLDSEVLKSEDDSAAACSRQAKAEGRRRRPRPKAQ